MNVFDAVKQSVTTRQAAVMYGLQMVPCDGQCCGAKRPRCGAERPPFSLI